MEAVDTTKRAFTLNRQMGIGVTYLKSEVRFNSTQDARVHCPPLEELGEYSVGWGIGLRESSITPHLIPESVEFPSGLAALLVRLLLREAGRLTTTLTWTKYRIKHG